MFRRASGAAVAALTPLLLGAPAPATTDDGARVAFRLQDARIAEASGMVDLGDRTVLTNDSGDSGRLYVVDQQGRTTAVREYAGEAVDVEALAPAGPDAVWVGDIGDNDGVRSSVTVRRVPLDGGPVASYALTYPGGPADAESLLVDPDGRLVVVTKSFAGAAVLRAPAPLDPDAPNRLEQVARLPEVAATDAALLSPTRVLVRGYADAGLYAWPSWDPVRRVPLPEQRQGETISVGPAGTGPRVRVGSEGVGSAVQQLPASAAAEPTGSPAADPTASPTASAAPSASPADVDGDGDGGGVDRLALGTGLLLGGLGLAAVGWLVQRRRRPTRS